MRTGRLWPRARIPARAGGMSWTRAIRIAYQATFLSLFLWLLACLATGDPRDLPYSAFHHADPLSAIGLVLGVGTLPGALAWALVLIALTLVFGRVFCGWICPLGTLQQAVSATRRGRTARATLTLNRYRRWYALKYYVLAATLLLALGGSLQSGLLDPLSLAARGLASGLWPVLPGGRPVPGGWVASGLLLAVLVASGFIPRLFCRALCPLGALLGVFARFALFRVSRAEANCTSCRLCGIDCQGADEPWGHHRVGECHVCLNCVERCDTDGLAYRFLPPLPAPPPQPDLSRRLLLGSALGAFAVAPVLRATGGGRDVSRARAIRPPGACAEAELLERCVKCSLCQQVCPTGAIHPALGQAGVEGIFTPVIVPRRGWCEYACTRCGEVCPTGAIARLTPARKTGYDGQPPVRIGTAFIDRGRCLPWAMQTPCIVCEEMCPTAPKAIWFEQVEATDRNGRPVHLKRPAVDPGLCVGCGICENKCPVGEQAAIVVSSVGETRHPLNRMVL